MPRAKYQVLIIPYCLKNNATYFCVFRRSDMHAWQFIAGGGEDCDDSILESAKRESFEEAGIPAASTYSKLDTCCSIPTNCFQNARTLWGRDCLVIPEYAFAVKIEHPTLQLSREHTECRWLPYEDAYALLKYDSNRTALWELNQRIHLGMLEGFSSTLPPQNHRA